MQAKLLRAFVQKQQERTCQKANKFAWLSHHGIISEAIRVSAKDLDDYLLAKLPNCLEESKQAEQELYATIAQLQILVGGWKNVISSNVPLSRKDLLNIRAHRRNLEEQAIAEIEAETVPLQNEIR
jgi:hypothetical protein